MSNKVKIIRIEHTGNPVCLDRVVVTEKDTEIVEYVYSTDGFEIARAMCDGYRFRFNQHRSLRKQYGDKKDENGHMLKDDTNLVPIGHTVSDFTDAQARKEFPFLSFIPGVVEFSIYNTSLLGDDGTIENPTNEKN